MIAREGGVRQQTHASFAQRAADGGHESDQVGIKLDIQREQAVGLRGDLMAAQALAQFFQGESWQYQGDLVLVDEQPGEGATQFGDDACRCGDGARMQLHQGVILVVGGESGCCQRLLDGL